MPGNSKAPAGNQGLTENYGTLSVDDWDATAHHVDGTFVLVVKVTGGLYRRRCFMTAAAAQRACQRATSRGENATVWLAELKPLHRVIGDMQPELVT